MIDQMDEIYAKLGRGPVPIDEMLTRESHDREVENIFKKVWLKVGHLHEIPNAGDYKVKQLPFANTSIILVRGRDNEVRAFHNICPHRGNKVVPETGHETFGKARGHVLTCRFHGWVFDTAGSVRQIPQAERFPAPLDTNCLGLLTVHCDRWNDYIFINLDRQPQQTLREFLGGIVSHFDGYPFGDADYSRKYSAVIKCNWKVGLYAFSEAYHVETIHANTLPGVAGAVTEQTEYKLYGPHSTSGYYVKESGSMKPTTVTGRLAEVLHRAPHHRPHPELLPAKVNPSRRNDFMFEFPVLFPNMVMHLCAGLAYPGMTHFDHVFWPIDENSCLWEGTNYYRSPQTPSEYLAITHTDALHRNAWLEDTGTMEDTHAAMMSGVLDRMYLMDDEVMVRASHHAINEAAKG
jgi:phenylpropionate dioxygenase-like ring-hydroxylating dioxygenase large terminal subunit